MAVSYANHAEIIDTDDNDSVTVTVPASLAQDEMWVIFAIIDSSLGNVTINTPSGFTQIGSQFAGATNGLPDCALYYKIAGASESNATLTCSSAGRDTVVYSIRITKDTDETLALDAVGTLAAPSGSGTTVNAPDITVGADGSLALLFWGVENNADAESVISSPSGTTKRDTRTGTPGTAFATQSVNAGTYAPGNWTWNDADDNRIAQTFSIKPIVTLIRRQKPISVDFAVRRASGY